MSALFAGAEQAPAFADAAQCRAWLDTIPLSDAAQAQAALLKQVGLLNRAGIGSSDRLDILELLRHPIHGAQEECGLKFTGKPLPLTEPQRAAFEASRALWHGLATGYMRCAEACFAGDAAMTAKAALLFQRALAALVCEQFETHRAGQNPPSEHWRVLHQLYAAAEQLQVAEQQVDDATRLGTTPGSPAAAYVEALLLAAANLHEYGQRQISWIARWARRWATKVRILAAAPTLTSHAIPLCVDLAADRPAGYMPLATPGARWLETTELRRSLKKRLVLLERGEPPAKLNLGADCTQPACEHLLKLVYQRWCRGAAVRGCERRPASGSCRLIVGAEAIHYYLSGSKPFRPAAATDAALLRRQQEELATFGHISTRRDEDFSEQHGFAVEQWQLEENWHMVDASAAGLRIARRLEQDGCRVGHGQLIAASPADAQSFLLGSVRWALVGDALQLGLNLFPGCPEPVAVRGTGIAGEKFRQAFLLPAVAALHHERSIVVAVGSFKLGRVVEVLAGSLRLLRLTRLIERGADFERAAYEPA